MSDFKLGEHEQAINQLLEGQGRMEQAILEIKLSLAEKKGERRVVVWIASIAGTLAAGLMTVLIDLAGRIMKH